MDFSICNEYIRELGLPQIEMGPEARIDVIIKTIVPNALNNAHINHKMGKGIETERERIEWNYFRARQLAERLSPEEKCRAEMRINSNYKKHRQELEKMDPGFVYGNQYV